jgi:hypothetical protein
MNSVLLVSKFIILEEEMKKYLLIPLLIIAAVSLSACSIFPRIDPGTQITEKRNVSGFHEVRFTTAGEMTITQAETESLQIEAGKNIMPHITTEVKDGVLIIGMDESRLNFGVSQPVKYTLSVKDLDGIDLSGAGNIETGQIKSGDMTINLSGAGNISVEKLQADSLNARLSGAGNISVANLLSQSLKIDLSGAGNFSMAGKAPEQSALLTGLGSYQAGDLESARVKVQVSGAGGATVWATELLDVIISGAGSVNYYGSPKVNEDVNGLGSVRSLGNK